MHISAIIPVHNDKTNLGICLAGIRNTIRRPDEIILVDDASTDGSGASVRNSDIRKTVLPPPPRGPAFARNHGACLATGDLLVFLDADTSPHPDIFIRIEREFSENPGISALFGSYDNQPSHRGLISQYKNLQHHYVHQNSRRDAWTFWAGCGAIRTDVFRSTGGFNVSFARPSIEDIELGYRLYRSGHQIRLCPHIQVTHLKKWTLRTWLHSDIFCRAIPWTRLISNMPHIPRDLNVTVDQRLSAVLVWIEVFLLISGFIRPAAWIGLMLILFIRMRVNKDFYRFLKDRMGGKFIIAAVFLHGLYLFYSSLIFVLFGGFKTMLQRP